MDIVVLFARVCLMVGATCLIGIFIGYPAAHWIGRKVGGFLSCLPAERFAQAPPALGIPAALVMQGDLQGGMEKYEALLADHPHLAEIHFRMLEIALGPMHSEECGERILQRGLASLQNESERSALSHLAAEIRAGTYRPLEFLDSRHPPSPARRIVYNPDAPKHTGRRPGMES